MPVCHRAFKNLPVALLSLSATFALSIALVGCGASSTANEWTWARGSSTAGASDFYSIAAASNVSEARYNWTGSVENSSPAGEYASNAAGQNHFWEFSPATELWSWASVAGGQEEVYVASMPELTPSDNAWSWANRSDSVDASGIYSLAAAKDVSGAPYSWAGSRDNSSDARIYAADATGQNHFWEFSPATELWSWADGSGGQDKTYLASMPELTPTDNAWTWVSSELGAGSSYGSQGLAAASHGPRCASVNWVESVTGPLPCVQDELQASLNDYWRYGP